VPRLRRSLRQERTREKRREKKDSPRQIDLPLIVSRSQKIKLTCYCKSKGKRKRARFIVPLRKKRPRQKQIPHSVRDDKKKERGKSRFIAKISDGAEFVLGGASVQEQRDFSLYRPTDSQERIGKRKHWPIPFEMTGGGAGGRCEETAARRD